MNDLIYVVTRNGKESYMIPLKFENKIEQGNDLFGYIQEVEWYIAWVLSLEN